MPRRRSPGVRELPYYRAHFRESILPDGVVCLECGKLRKTLGSHMLLTHDMTLDNYRERWGFNRQTVFVAASTAAKLRRLAVRRNLGAYGSGRNLAKARAARRFDEPHRIEARLKMSEAKKRLYASGWQPRRPLKVSDGTLRRLATKRPISTTRIAAQVGLSIDRVRQRLQALKLLPPRKPRGRPADRQKMLELRRQGLWPLEIARRMGLKPQLVRKTLWILRSQGIEVPVPPRPRPNNNRRISDDVFVRAFIRHGSVKSIAAALGVSRAYVIAKTHRLRRAGQIPPVVDPRSARPRRGSPTAASAPKARPTRTVEGRRAGRKRRT